MWKNWLTLSSSLLLETELSLTKLALTKRDMEEASPGKPSVMSRAAARNQFTMDEYMTAMEGIYTTSVNTDTLDEAPMAYKALDQIVDVVQESVDIIDIMKPIYNFKAAD